MSPSPCVAAILVTAAALAGCGGDFTARAPTATTGASRSGPPTAGPRLRGADYTLTLAPGWHATTKARQPARVDRVIATARPRAVVVVGLFKAAAGVKKTKLLRDQARREIAGVHPTATTRQRSITLDGEHAITYEYRSTSPAHTRLQSRQVLVVRNGYLHVIAVTGARAQFTATDTAFGTMLGTWRWAGRRAAAQTTP